MSEIIKAASRLISDTKSDVRQKFVKVGNLLRSMDIPSKQRFAFVRQSSLAPNGKRPRGLTKEESQKLVTAEQLDATLTLLFYAAKGDVQGVKDMLAKGVNVNAADFDQRTALHVAACENCIDVLKILISKNADVNCEDRWGSTPLADAQHYGNLEICKLLEEHGGKLAKNARNSLMRMSSALIPEYEIDQATLNLDVPDQVNTKKGELYRVAMWQGTKVWVKFLPGNIASDEQLVLKFKNELELLLKLRHPNVVQFLGAVTQTSPMMIITEFLCGVLSSTLTIFLTNPPYYFQGSLKKYMEAKDGRRLDPARAVAFALDIARGMNYLHELKPDAIVHRHLKPSNLLLRDAHGHIKVANLGLSHSLREADTVEDSSSTKHQGSFCRYMAPEIYRRDPYDGAVDVFAFGIIVQEMMEGHIPFPEITEDVDVAQAYIDGKRPSFRHGGRRYPPCLKELIEDCWDEKPANRPTFGEIIQRLENIQGTNTWRNKLKTLFVPGRK